MKNDPGIRVYGLDEEPDFIPVPEKHAQRLRRLAKLLSEEEVRQGWTEEERETGQRRMAETRKAAGDPKSLLERIRKLDERDAELVPALLDLMEFGDGSCEHGSWMLSIAQDLLWRVAWLGPGPANEHPFGGWLLAQVVAYDYFESWIEDARRTTERYPNLVKPSEPAR